jgi:hypothetical protein
MNIEQKLAFIQKALELGADIDVSFHNIKDKKQAKEIAVDLSKEFGLRHKNESHNGTNWYKLRTTVEYDYSLAASIFYDEYLQEDVDLSGMKESNQTA